MPTSVLRRYTPPTCTLEVRANQSSLSRWADQTVLRDVRFNLNLDDPQRPDARIVQVSGDRTQLEALSDAVSRYVQNLLDTDLGATDTALLHLTPQSPRLLPDHNVEVLPLRAERANGTIGSPMAVHAPIASAESGIFLEPKGLLAHDLHLGTLSTPESGDVVRLSAVQLFDLANALDDYSAEMLALPSQQRAASGTRRWASVAAMLVLAIGATGGITKFVMDVSAPAPQVAQESAPENSVAVQPVPSSAPTTGTPLPVPGATPQAGGLKAPPAAPPGSVQPGAFPFPVPGQQPGAVPPQGQRVPVPPPGAVAVRPVPSGAVAQAPQPNPAGVAQGINVPPNPTVARQAQPDAFSTSQAPSISSTAEAAPEATGDVAIAPPPTARNRPATDLSRTGVEIPQTNEVQSYFQARWQPPENLGETLEYRLTLGANGAVEQITPLGDAAGIYIDRTNMPLLGDQFVSPLTPYQRAMVRVVLAPDGRVQTFLEEVN